MPQANENVQKSERSGRVGPHTHGERDLEEDRRDKAEERAERERKAADEGREEAREPAEEADDDGQKQADPGNIPLQNERRWYRR